MTRKHSVAFLALAVALAVGACTDLLNEDPKSFTTTETFYQTGPDLNSATVAIYGALAGGNWDGLQGFGPWTAVELASDQARFDNREPNFNTRSPDFLDWTPTTGQTGGYWNVMYRVIGRANLVLAKGPGISQAVDAPTKGYNLAEARFLRGYAYLWLTKVYDDVPLLLTPEEQANPQPPRTPVEQVHQAIIQDLTAAQAALPAAWPSNDGYGLPTQGRVRRWAAKMALADLYLWRSSFMQTNEWAQASSWAKQVIDSGGSLNSDYIKTFRTTNEGNPEMIFVLSNTGLDSRTSNVFQLFYYPRDWGLDLGQGGGWGLIHPSAWFYNSYRPGDYRRSTGPGYTSDSAYVSGGCGLSNLCATPLGDGPMPWKYRKSDGGAVWWLGDVDVPLYRYAEAILIYAEAQNELGNAGEAITYLNMIRARARQGTGAENRPEPANYPNSGDTLGLRDAIFMERAWEFAFEAKRWFDLVRRDSHPGEAGYWANSLVTHDSISAALGDNQGVARVTRATALPYKKRFPIPQTERDVNPALTQNPGY